jgi:hypothetical protein
MPFINSKLYLKILNSLLHSAYNFFSLKLGSEIWVLSISQETGLKEMRSLWLGLVDSGEGSLTAYSKHR